MPDALETLIQNTFPNVTISFEPGTPGAITVSYEKNKNRYKITSFIINGTEMAPVILDVTEREVLSFREWSDFVTKITPEYLNLPFTLRPRSEPLPRSESLPPTPIRRVMGSSGTGMMDLAWADGFETSAAEVQKEILEKHLNNLNGD